MTLVRLISTMPQCPVDLQSRSGGELLAFPVASYMVPSLI